MQEQDDLRAGRFFAPLLFLALAILGGSAIGWWLASGGPELR